jgi:glycosyltransferase involved in cell wall biosynthesis
MYGGIMADQVTRGALSTPTVVSFCGSDLLGENLSGKVRQLVAGYGIRCSHQAARRASAVIVKSRNLALALPTDVDPGKVTVVPSGIDLERFRPLDRAECRERLGFRADGFHVLFAYSSGASVKRPWLAEAAAEMARAKQPDVEFHPMQGVSPDQVPLWINACDCLLLTSLHEGSPNVVKEALACNLPVVSVDVGDVAERLEGLEGCYLSGDTPEELSEKLLQVYEGPRRVKSRGGIEELGIERTAYRLRALYEGVCNPNPVAVGGTR